MADESAHKISRKLIKSNLISKDNKQSVRYVELENYKLWAYMITHKHGFTLKDTYLCLWVNEEEFNHKQEIYSHYGRVEKMNHIVMMLYDDINNFSFSISRYILDRETEIMKKVLTSHVREELVIKKSFDLNIYSGYCITNLKKLDNMVLGLSSDQVY